MGNRHLTLPFSPFPQGPGDTTRAPPLVGPRLQPMRQGEGLGLGEDTWWLIALMSWDLSIWQALC